MNTNFSIHTQKYITTLEKETGCTVGVYAYGKGTPQQTIAYNATQTFIAGSVVKLFLAYAVLTEYAGHTDEIEVTILPEDIRQGFGVLHETSLHTYPLHDVLYFLLAHSDNTAQHALERVIGIDIIHTHVKKLALQSTFYAPIGEKEHRATTTPYDVVSFLARLFEGILLPKKENTILLALLAKNRNTYFGMRLLPCALNTTTPEITTYYSKTAKLRDVVADNMILVTEQDVLFVSIFIQNLFVDTYGNNVDHKGILAIANIALQMYNSLRENSPTVTAF